MTQESHCRLYSLRKPTIIQKDTYTLMFTAALFTIARSWKQPKCPSTDEWKRRCGIYKERTITHSQKRTNLSLI